MIGIQLSDGQSRDSIIREQTLQDGQRLIEGQAGIAEMIGFAEGEINEINHINIEVDDDAIVALGPLSENVAARALEIDSDLAAVL